MEKTSAQKAKLYDKHADVDSRAGQPGDMSWWQREMMKNFVGGGSLDSDIPAPPYISAMPWSYPQPLWSHPLFQHVAHSPMPRSPGQTHEQEKEHEGQQGGTQSIPSDKSQPPPSCDASGPSAGTGRHPFHSASIDSNFDDLHNLGGIRPPCSYPGGFIFPMPPYPGQLDPLMLWMHQMRRQAAYLYSMSGCRNGFQSPLPIPSAGANQRGFIKIPSGIPQKQTHLWETQSSENMQLWATITQLCATVARAEAEIFCQRGKISKLEDDLEAMRTRQDAFSEAVKSSTVSPQTRKDRRKRTATVPVAILGLPASQPLPVRAQVKKARGSMNEGNFLRSANKLVSEENCKQAGQNITLELTNGSIRNGDGNSIPLTVGLNQSESRTDTTNKDMIDRQHSNIDSSCVDMIDSSMNQNCIRSSPPGETPRETTSPQNMEIKQECITNPLTNEAGRSNEEGNSDGKRDETCTVESSTKQTLYSGDYCRDSETMKGDNVCIIEDRAQQRVGVAGASIKSELTGIGKGDTRLEGVVIVSAGDSMHDGLLSISNNAVRPNAIRSGNAISDWQNALQNGHKDVSAQRDKEAVVINACALDGFDGTDEWTEEVMEVLK